jgi:hypothetical protein
MKIKIPKTPHWGQREILDYPARFKIVNCGRRWGKSLGGLFFVLESCVKKFEQTKRKIRAWIIAPTFPLVREDWLLAEELWKDLITKKNKTEMHLELLNLFDIEFKSAEREDEGLRGAGIDVALLDECARISQKAWQAGIRPSLSDREGVAMFISTPKGKNWFYSLFLRGQSSDKHYKSWRHTSKDSPYFSIEEYNQAKKELPELVFQQEFEAEFLEDEAIVFRGVEKCKTPWLPQDKQAKTGYEYVIGLDLARATDFTVITVFDLFQKRVCDFERFQDILWNLQKERVKNFAYKYNHAQIVMDSTGVGDPIYEDLVRFGLNVIPINFTHEIKNHIIEKLILAIEQQLITFPDIPQLIEELKAFTYKISPMRRIIYGAPEGFYDDCVISLALAIWEVDLWRRYLPKKEPTSLYRDDFGLEKSPMAA